LLSQQISRKLVAVILVLALIAVLSPSRPVQAYSASTGITITKYAVDGKTKNQVVTLSYEEMRASLPVIGDGQTHYYHQGPIYVDDVEARWNQAEDSNFYDFGALKGTRLTDLCDLVGGMQEGETLDVIGADNVARSFPYRNVYQYAETPRAGPMVIAWSKDGSYPDSGFDEGMRLVFFADTSVNTEGLHVFGNWDWHEVADEKYWYYREDGGKKYPTTSGLSIYNVDRITIFSHDPPWWDINADRTCSLADVDKIGEQWGQTGEPGWITQDVNRDGQINLLDVVKLGMYWGKHY
jgi:hypothetical protein